MAKRHNVRTSDSCSPAATGRRGRRGGSARVAGAAASRGAFPAAAESEAPRTAVSWGEPGGEDAAAGRSHELFERACPFFVPSKADLSPSAGRRSSSASAMSGGLITWGRANYGQLGHGRKQRADLPTPTTVSQLQGRPLQGVSCGHFHSAAVVAASPAQVHTWGRGALGLLGHGDEEDCYVPRPVKALAGIAIRQVACGAYHTVAVAESYRLFSWGWRLEQARGGAIVESYSTLPEQVHALDGLEVRAR